MIYCTWDPFLHILKLKHYNRQVNILLPSPIFITLTYPTPHHPIPWFWASIESKPFLKISPQEKNSSKKKKKITVLDTKNNIFS